VVLLLLLLLLMLMLMLGVSWIHSAPHVSPLFAAWHR
jgi:hypothetical protein